MAGFKLDLTGLKRQLEQKVKPRLLQGIQEGLKEHAPRAEQKMTYYIEENVYKVYTPDPSNPNAYERTQRLLNSVRSHVDGTKLSVAVEGVGYAERVAGGHDHIPYDYPYPNGLPAPNQNPGNFLKPRDWANSTAREYKENAEQEGSLKRDLISATNRRLKGG
jgi:hypothetical protein